MDNGHTLPPAPFVRTDGKALYPVFSYGSNLWMEQIVRRTEETWPADRPPQRAFLADYDFVFNMHDSGQVFGNIMPGGSGVHGVVYLYSEAALARLDVFESGYSRLTVGVTLESGEQLEAFAYIAQDAYVGPAARPSDAYLQRILRGAREQRLPAEYIETLERAGAAPDA